MSGKRKDTYFVCKCACGVVKKVYSSSLISGKTKSCGCHNRATQALRLTTHGNSKTSEYRSWIYMRGRCSNPNNTSYGYYGGRGIKVCEQWDSSFQIFLADMGPKPTSLHTIDRINVDLGYEPGNCRWATMAQQSLNKRRRNGTAGFTHVHYCANNPLKPFAARPPVVIDGVRKKKHIGYFKTAALAVEAVKRFEI